MNEEIAIKVIEQLRKFNQNEEAGYAITILDAIHNAGYVIHSKTTLTCTDEWRPNG